jgi:release factor glutamine methyltransferase
MESEYLGLTYGAIRRRLRDRLESSFGAKEAHGLMLRMLEHISGLSATALLQSVDLQPSYEQCLQIDEVFSRLIKGEPLQYITREQSFFARTFEVGPGVLIPRPETEELADMIIRDLKDSGPYKILDLGSGSGCLAITLDLELPDAMVDAIDISMEAMTVSLRNQEKLGSSVRFALLDMLNAGVDEFGGAPFDVLVSNPPYVLESEKGVMKANVLDYEPELALFVPDDDALRFYSTICSLALKGLLKKGGLIYFEINPLCSNELIGVMNSMGFTSTLINDLQGRSRFIRASC